MVINQQTNNYMQTTKQRIKQFSFLIILSFSLGISLTSCEKDLYEDGIKNSSRNISVKDVSLSNLDKTTSSKINEKITAIKSLKNETNNQSKFQYNDALGVFIDTENGKLVNNNGKLYYTFPMFRKGEEKLENVIFTPLASGEMETYFAKYNIKQEDFKNLTVSEISNLNPIFQKIDYGLVEVCTELTLVITTYPNCPYPNGIHTDANGNATGIHCDGETATFVFTFCNGGGGGGSDGSTGGGITGNNTGGTHTGGANTGGIATTPVDFSPEDIEITEFIKQLSIEQNNCLNGLNGLPEDVKKSILDLLNPNIALAEDCDGNPITQEQQFDYLENVLDDICESSNNNPLPTDTVLFDNVSGGEIFDINEYLKCFDLNQSAIFVLYVDQPIANSNATHNTTLNGVDPGHTFISILQNNVRRIIGFYPSVPVIPGVNNITDGVLVDNSNHEFDVSISYGINSTQLTNVINYIKIMLTHNII